MHVSAVRPLRYRLRVQIYEFLLILPPVSAVFFVCRTRFRPFTTTRPENLRTFSRNPSTFVPKSTAFRRPSPTLHNRLRHARRKPPLAPHARVTRTQPFFVFCLHTFTYPGNPLMHNELGVKVSPPFFLHPALHPPHCSPPRNNRGRKEPKAMKTGAQGEAFTRNTLYFKRLCVNRREHTRGEAFTRNTLKLNILQAKGEEVKAKNRKTSDARASRVRVRRSPHAGRPPRGQEAKKRPSLNPLSSPFPHDHHHRSPLTLSRTPPRRRNRGMENAGGGG